jgi:hypothetical protein
MKAESSSNVCVSAAEAARYLDVTYPSVSRLARQGYITRRKLPGCDPRYLMEAVESLARSATLPAIHETPELEEPPRHSRASRVIQS